jgi:hypothetical protein
MIIAVLIGNKSVYTSGRLFIEEFLRDTSENCIKLEHPGNSKILGHNSREQGAHNIECSQREQECTNTSTSFVHEIQVCYEAESYSFILQVFSNNSVLSPWCTYERNPNPLQNPSSKSARISVCIYKPDAPGQTD